MAPYLNSALVSVIPLRFGSGMKGKIGEAMAYGLPSVTTSIGAEGMGLVDGVDALLQIVQRNLRHGLYYFTETQRCGVPLRRRLETMLHGSGVRKRVNRELSDILARYGSTSRLECDSVK